MAKGDDRRHGKQPLPMRAEANQTNPGHHFVRAALEFGQHPMGLIQVTGFAENFCAKANDRVGRDDECVRMLLGDAAGFAISIDLANFPRSQMFGVDFLDLSRDDLKLCSQFA